MERDKGRSGWRWAGWLAVALVTVLIAYPLSIGPIAWLFRDTERLWILTGLDYFCAPAYVALEYAPASVRQLYLKYLSWWFGTPLT